MWPPRPGDEGYEVLDLKAKKDQGSGSTSSESLEMLGKVLPPSNKVSKVANMWDSRKSGPIPGKRSATRNILRARNINRGSFRQAFDED